MNKTIFGITIVIMFAAMLVAPVCAVPPEDKKVPIIIHFSNQVGPILEEKITGNVIHRFLDVEYDIAIDVADVPTYTGKAYASRKVLIIPREVGVDLVIQDDYVFEIDGEEGTFEGSAVIVLKGYLAPTATSPPDYERGKAHALLQGTDAFDGQTINAGHHWIPFGPITWWGYLKL